MNNPISEKDVLKNLEPFSKALGKAAGQVWKMFVLRYVAKGIGQIFLAGIIVWFAWYFFHPAHQIYMLAPWLIAAVLVYDAIQLLINPYYFAMNDVAMRLKSENIFKR